MNNIKSVSIAILLITIPLFAHGQSLNWANLDKELRHILNIHGGIEFGVTYGIGYSYQLKTNRPILLMIEQIHPSGEKPFDDFKTKMGGQIRWLQTGHFQFSTKIQGIFRRFQNPIVTLVNFGSDLSGTFGYYRPKWFVAGDVGFDKAIVTHFKHTQSYKNDFPSVQDGWYEPATGGNFYYGLQAGYSFRRTDIYIKAGNILTQDFKTKPIIPFYGQLGINRKF